MSMHGLGAKIVGVAGVLDNDTIVGVASGRLAECGISLDEFAAEADRRGIGEDDVGPALDLVAELCPESLDTARQALRASMAKMLIFTAVAGVAVVGVGVWLTTREAKR